MKTFNVTVRDFDPKKDLPQREKVVATLSNPKHHVKAAVIVLMNGYYWLYVQGIHSYNNLQSMDNYAGAFNSITSAKMRFTKHEKYKGIWANLTHTL